MPFDLNPAAVPSHVPGTMAKPHMLSLTAHTSVMSQYKALL